MWGKFVVRAAVVTTALSSLVSGTSAAAQSCTWKATPLPPAEVGGYVHVVGATGTGNYSGTTRWADPSGSLVLHMVLWNRGEPVGRVHAPPPGRFRPSPVDENQRGTILLDTQTADGMNGGVFTYSGGHEGRGTYRQLPTPAGFTYVWPEAINNRGDAIGRGSGGAVLWPGDGGAPVVISLPPDKHVVQVVDLDDDGTVLLYLNDGPHLWRAGTLTQLAQPAGYRFPWAEAIRGGKIVGHARTTDEQATYQGFFWPAPDKVVPIQDNALGEGINENGLVIGRASVYSPGGVWFGTHPLGEIPDNSSIRLISDDNSVLGTSSAGDNNTVWHPTCG